MRNKSKILALALTVLMLFSSVNLTAFAEGIVPVEPETEMSESGDAFGAEDEGVVEEASIEDDSEEAATDEISEEASEETVMEEIPGEMTEETVDETERTTLSLTLPVANIETSYTWNTIDGKTVSNQANSKPKALLFFPVTVNPGQYYDANNDYHMGSLLTIYYTPLIHNGKYVDTVILDTGCKTANEVKTARTNGKKNQTMDLDVTDKIDYCYDTTANAENNTILSALNEYCSYVGMEFEQGEGYYFLLDKDNKIVACKSTKENGFQVDYIGGECANSLRQKIELKNNLEAPQDLAVKEYTDNYVKLTWTASPDVDEYRIYSSHREYGSEEDKWTVSYMTQVLRGLIQSVNGSEIPMFDGNKVTVYFWNDSWNRWGDEENAKFYVVAKDDCDIESSVKSNIVKLSEVGKEIDPEAFAKAELVDDEGNVISELSLHVGESKHLNVRLIRNNGNKEIVANDGKYHLNWLAMNYPEDLKNGHSADSPEYRFYRTKVLDTSNTYVKGLAVTGEVGGEIPAICLRFHEQLNIADVVVPVTVLPAEAGEEYEDNEKIPEDVCASVDELNRALLEKLSNKEHEISLCLKKSVLDEYEASKGSKWDIMDEVFHVYDGQEDVKPWEGDYLFYNMNFDMVFQDVVPGFGTEAEYQGVSYESFILKPKYFREGEKDDEYVAERINDLVNNPTGALYKCKFYATDKEKADACVDWIKKNVSYIPTADARYHSAYSALYNKKATCEGYTMLLYRLLKEFGINSRLIGSELDSKGDSHAFSLVMLDGKYYYYDATGGEKCKYEGEFGYTADRDSETKAKWMEFYYVGNPYLTGKFKTNIIDKLATEPYVIQPPAEPDNLTVTLLEPSAVYTYTGSAIKPAIRVTNNGELLVENVDYTVKYTNNVKASYDKNGAPLAESKLPRITVTGKGNLSGSNYTTFKIEPKKLTELEHDTALCVAAGTKAAPVLFYNNMKLGSSDYVLAEPKRVYKADDVEPSVTIQAKAGGNYQGELTIPVKVVSKNELKKFSVAFSLAKLYYNFFNGTAQIPEFTIKQNVKNGEDLTEDDYYVVYPNGLTKEALEKGGTEILPAGTYKMTFVGKGLYAGCSITKSYTIYPRVIGKNDAESAFTVDGVEDKTFVTQGVTMENLKVTYHKGEEDEEVLVPGRDYKATYSNHKKISTAKAKGKVKITFAGNYKGSYALTPKEFEVLPKVLNDTTEGLEVILPNKLYGTKPGVYKSTPYVVLDDVLLKTSDYTVSYFLDEDMTIPMGTNTKKGEQKLDMTNVSSATVYVMLVGKGNYNSPDGTCKKAQYTVYKKSAEQRDISKAAVAFYNEKGVKNSNVSYNGSKVKPEWMDVTYKNGKLTEILSKDADFEVIYICNVNKGKATVVLNGTGDTYVGSKIVTFNIVAQNLKSITGLMKDLFQ